jgi:SnoaL-like domain
MELPKAISAYFEVDRSDGAAISDCFTPHAVVIDEGNRYSGHQAIREWKRRASGKYSYTVEPFAIEEVAGKTVVTAHVVGNFPGGSVDLRYFFALESDKIAALEIKL